MDILRVSGAFLMLAGGALTMSAMLWTLTCLFLYEQFLRRKE